MNRNNRSEYDANLSMAKYVKRESRFSEKNKRKAAFFVVTAADLHHAELVAKEIKRLIEVCDADHCV